MRKFTALLAAAAIAISAFAPFSALAAGGDTLTDGTQVAARATAAPTEAPADETASAEIPESLTYQAYEQVAGYIADRYLDDSYTAEDIMKLGLSRYLEDKGDEALIALLKAALGGLDPYSDFYSSKEYQEYTDDLNSTFYGLGIIMRQDGEYVAIDGFAEENSLAERTGFMIGDKITKVNGVNVVGSSMTEVRNLIIGELGTTVLITLQRDGEEIEITGTRTAVSTSTVSGGVLEGGIGYISIGNFSTSTADEFAEIAQKLKDEGVKNLILDLRNSPGGVVSSATHIAEQLVPAGKIVEVRFRNATQNYIYYSDLMEVPFKIIVLVNNNTASSAEILASAIQDSGAGILMGEQTYGKAVIQSSYTLRNGMAFKLTVGQYLTRNGNEIDHVGLTPDIEVSNYHKRIDTTSYTKFDFLTPVSVGMSGTNVTAAKERLSVMKYFIGNLGNNVFNTDLEESVRAFQRDNELTDTGVLDIPTQIKLKEVFETLETTVDVQMQEAYKRFGGNVDDLYD